MRKRIISLALCLGLLCSIAGSARAQRERRDLLRDEWHQSYPLSAQGRITLNNINGPVRIQGWERNEVRVDAVKTAYKRERLDEARIEVNASGDSIEIHTRYPYSEMTFTDEEPRRYDNPANVEYTISVPRGARLENIELINGALDLSNLNGEARASCINGKLTARDLSGAVKLSTINGTLDAAFAQLDADKPLALNSINGELRLTIPSNANASIKASTVHGSITNNLGLPVRHGRYVGTDLAGQIGTGGPRIRLDNVNGVIDIRHASDGRAPSPVTNLLSSASEDYGPSEEAIQRQVAREVEQAMREAEQAREEARRAGEEARREAEQAQREAEQAQREAQREAEQQRTEAQREAAQQQAEAQREAEQARREAEQTQREAQREAEQAQREAEQARREAERERTEALREAERERQEALREAERERQQAQREQEQAAREVAQAQREAAREQAEAQREVAQAQAEAAREAARATVEGNYFNSDNYYPVVERQTMNFNTQGTPRVRIETFDGPVTVEAWDRAEVQFTAVKRATDDRMAKATSVRANQSGNEVSIVAEFDKSQARTNNGGATVSLEVRVPRNSNLNIHTGDGRVRLTGVSGEVELRTGDGAVDVSSGRGRLRVETGDGRVRIESFEGEAEAQTGDGRMTFEGRFTRLTARTGDGGILLSMPADADATIETDAEVVVNEGLGVSADNSNDQQRVRRWRVGRGNATINLRTNDGSIYLRRAEK